MFCSALLASACESETLVVDEEIVTEEELTEESEVVVEPEITKLGTVGIVGGYARDEKIFLQNNRLKTVEVWYDDLPEAFGNVYKQAFKSSVPKFCRGPWTTRYERVEVSFSDLMPFGFGSGVRKPFEA